MRILVTGGSSFVGAHFCLRAAQRHEVHALHHRTALRLGGVIPVRCDLRRERDRARLAEIRPDVVVHLASRIRTVPGEDPPGAASLELNRLMMDAVLNVGKPVVYGSSTVVHWAQQTPYGESRRADEARLRQSGLAYAILRPCAPYGPELSTHKPGHRESFQTLVSIVRNSPVVPIVGDGQYRRQPIHVYDLSDALLALLDRGLSGQELDAGGAEALTFDGIVDTIATAAGRKVRKLHVPKSLALRVIGLLPNMEPSLIGAVDTDEVADPGPLTAATGISPRGFSDGVRDLL